MQGMDTKIIGAPVWRKAAFVCALADDDRHLGHIIKADAWHAYDLTNADSNNGFTYLGAFQSVEEAILETERSIFQSHALVQAAGGIQ